MVKLRDSAPKFDCTAIVECEVVDLKWHELHCNQNLVLLFDTVEDDLDHPNDLATLCNAASRFEMLQCKLAVICRDDEFEILTWMHHMSAELGSKPIGFPVIVDVDNQIVSLYDMLSVDGPLWGHLIVDSNSNVRSIVAHSSPMSLNIDELMKSVEFIVESDGD